MKKWRYILLGVVIGGGVVIAAASINQTYYGCVLSRLDAMRNGDAVNALVKVCRQKHGFP